MDEGVIIQKSGHSSLSKVNMKGASPIHMGALSMGALSQDNDTSMSIMACVIIENAYLKPRHTCLHTFLYVNILLCDFLIPSAVSAAEWGKTGRLG